MRVALLQILSCVLTLLCAATAFADEEKTPTASSVPQQEQSDVQPLPALHPHWAFVSDSWKIGGTRIIDGDTARLIGLIDSPPMSNFLIDPQGRYFFVAETMWTRRNRGVRQDLLSFYDPKTLNLLFEIMLPGRLQIGGKQQILEASRDGKYVYVYNMDPATSVVVVDVAKRRIIATPAVPGCGLVFPFGSASFASLCAEGALSTTVLDGHMHASSTRTESFFDPENDPIIDYGVIDRGSGKGFLIAYSGLIYDAHLSEQTPLGVPWSIQEAAGLSRASMLAGDLAWRPGGAQPFAVHAASHRLYVLMHAGEISTHDESGSELWAVNTETHSVVQRIKLKTPAGHVAVSQDEHPLVFLSGDDQLVVLDALTGKELRRIDHVGTGVVVTAP